MVRARALLAAALVTLVPGLRPAAAEEVALTLANESVATLRCQILFAHWVTLDLPVLAPGATTALTIDRDPSTGALSIPRADGRAMMLEALACGTTHDWSGTLGRIGLDGVVRTPGRNARLTCGLHGTVSCSLVTGRSSRGLEAPRPSR
jgi:hypothetical protein